MDSRRATRRRIAVGTALTLGLFTVFVLVFVLDDLREATAETYEIAVVTEDANALSEGQDVRVAGQPVGTVESIDLVDEPTGIRGRTVATVELPVEVRSHVRRRSRVRFARQGIGGAGIIDIMPGPRDAPPLAPGDTLVAEPRVGRDRLARRTEAVLRAWDSLAASVAAIRAAADRPQRDMDAALAEIGEVETEFDRLARQYRTGPAAAMLGDDAWLDAVRRLRRVAAAVQRAFDGGPAVAAAGDSLGARAGELGEAIERMVARADVLRTRLARLEEQMRARGGLPSQVAADTALQAALRRVRAQLDSLVAETRENPLRFLF